MTQTAEGRGEEERKYSYSICTKRFEGFYAKHLRQACSQELGAMPFTSLSGSGAQPARSNDTAQRAVAQRSTSITPSRSKNALQPL